MLPQHMDLLTQNSRSLIHPSLRMLKLTVWGFGAPPHMLSEDVPCSLREAWKPDKEISTNRIEKVVSMVPQERPQSKFCLGDAGSHLPVRLIQNKTYYVLH